MAFVRYVKKWLDVGQIHPSYATYFFKKIAHDSIYSTNDFLLKKYSSLCNNTYLDATTFEVDGMV